MSQRLNFLAQLFDAMPIGVIVLDRQGRVVHFNRTEEQLARRERERALGRDFFTEVAPCMDVRALAGVFRDRIGREAIHEQVEISFAFPFLEGPRDVTVYLRSLELEGEPHAALFIQDVSAERSAERLQRSLAELLRPEAGSPIAGILASCGLLVHEAPQLDGPALHAVGDISYEASDLQHLLMNLLDISHLETHGRDVIVGQTTLAPLVSAAVANLARHAAHRGVRIDVVPLDDSIWAMTDPPLMSRILDSLLLTALRQSPEGSAVHVGLSTAGHGGPRITIRDEGGPLPDSELPTVIHHYRRAGEGALDPLSYGGREGLALTFVQIACASHGGQLVVEPSEQGTSYHVDLPRPDAATAFLGG